MLVVFLEDVRYIRGALGMRSQWELRLTVYFKVIMERS